MTKPNTVIFACVILLAVVAVALLGTAVFRKAQLDASSQEFAVEITPQILAGGAAVLEAHAHPALLQQQTSTSRETYFLIINLYLGDLQQLDSISGSSTVPLLLFSNNFPTAAYELDAVFEQGAAMIKIELTYTDGQWLVDTFEVVSNQLAE